MDLEAVGNRGDMSVGTGETKLGEGREGDMRELSVDSSC